MVSSRLMARVFLRTSTRVTVETPTPLRDKQGCGRCLIRRADGPSSILGPLSQMICFSMATADLRSLGKWKAGGVRAPRGKLGWLKSVDAMDPMPSTKLSHTLHGVPYSIHSILQATFQETPPTTLCPRLVLHLAPPNPVLELEEMCHHNE